jgi:hypothetical protein
MQSVSLWVVGVLAVVCGVTVGCSPPRACEPGATRMCVGAGACSGGQRCDSSGAWGACDCGSAAGDAGSAGGGTTGGGTAGGGTATGGGGAGGAACVTPPDLIDLTLARDGQRYPPVGTQERRFIDATVSAYAHDAGLHEVTLTEGATVWQLRLRTPFARPGLLATGDTARLDVQASLGRNQMRASDASRVCG